MLLACTFWYQPFLLLIKGRPIRPPITRSQLELRRRQKQTGESVVSTREVSLKGKALGTVDLLGLTSLDQLLFVSKI
jgi:hypothetical protein